MPYSRFVEIGRVALVNYGPLEGKLCVIVDVLDQNRALVDGPQSGVPRQILGFRRMSLTDIKIRVPRMARTTTVNKAFTKADVKSQWEKTQWGKRLLRRAAKASQTDFERFSAMLQKRKRSAAIRRKL